VLSALGRRPARQVERAADAGQQSAGSVVACCVEVSAVRLTPSAADTWVDESRATASRAAWGMSCMRDKSFWIGRKRRSRRSEQEASRRGRETVEGSDGTGSWFCALVADRRHSFVAGVLRMTYVFAK
jgi:hypothetical protein